MFVQIYGYSMGAQHAFQWAALYPSRVHRVAAICGLARTTDYNKVFLDSLKAALLSDSAYRPDGSFAEQPWHGLRAFARIYAGWGVSQRKRLCWYLRSMTRLGPVLFRA